MPVDGAGAGVGIGAGVGVTPESGAWEVSAGGSLEGEDTGSMLDGREEMDGANGIEPGSESMSEPEPEP